MIDEKIEKALECCSSNDSDTCNECPIDGKIKDDCRCGEYLAKHTLAYINRLKAEKAVSDRALELAVESYDNQSGAKQSFIEQAKQELEKERIGNATTKV